MQTRTRSLLAATGCVLLLGAPAVRGDGSRAEQALTEVLARHRLLLRETEVQVSSGGGGLGAELALAQAGLAAFEASLVERELLPPEAVARTMASLPGGSAARLSDPRPAAGPSRIAASVVAEKAPAHVSAAPAVVSAPSGDSADAGAARLGRLVADGAPEPLVEREVERLAGAATGNASEVRELVQEMIFVAVARTAVELQRALDAVRQNAELRAALRAELRRLRGAVAVASGELRESLARNAVELESRLRDAGDDAHRADVGLRERLRDQEPLLRNLARVGAALQDRAMAAIRASDGG